MKRFASSFPRRSDVGAEREKAREIFDRLQVEFSGRLHIAPYFWEHEPMRVHLRF